LFFFIVYYVICSYVEEVSLYSQIYSYSQSSSIIFIFVRWSPHFASIYTTQFLPNTTTAEPLSYTFSILHLLPIDSDSTSSFNDIILNYEQIIATNVSFTDDVRILKLIKF
jgi:hypothetical protein